MAPYSAQLMEHSDRMATMAKGRAEASRDLTTRRMSARGDTANMTAVTAAGLDQRVKGGGVEGKRQQSPAWGGARAALSLTGVGDPQHVNPF